MPQTSILLPGTAGATSDPIDVAAGAAVSVGLFVAAGGIADGDCAAVMVVTPGAPVRVALLSASFPLTQLLGPARYVVIRPGTSAPLGVQLTT